MSPADAGKPTMESIELLLRKRDSREGSPDMPSRKDMLLQERETTERQGRLLMSCTRKIGWRGIVKSGGEVWLGEGREDWEEIDLVGVGAAAARCPKLEFDPGPQT